MTTRIDEVPACQLGFTPGCDNVRQPGAAVASLRRGPPGAKDLPIVLRGTKPRLRERDLTRLYAIGCGQGWRELCATAAPVPLDPSRPS